MYVSCFFQYYRAYSVWCSCSYPIETASNVSGVTNSSIVSEGQKRAINSMIHNLKKNAQRGGDTLDRLTGILEAISQTSEEPATVNLTTQIMCYSYQLSL